MKHFLLPGSFCMFKFPYDDFLLFSKPENNTYVYVLERIKKFEQRENQYARKMMKPEVVLVCQKDFA